MDYKKLLKSEKSDRLPGYKWEELRLKVLKRDKDTCQKCGKPGNEVDHIVPKVRGGKDIMSNLRTLCNKCHKNKTKKDLRMQRIKRRIEVMEE